MATQNELDGVYMQVAYAHSRLSKAVRAKVGCCIVTPSFTLLCGYNGTANGYSNICETEDANGNLVTNPYVVHAEANAIAAAARTGVSLLGATAYITLSPCAGCAAVMRQVGITRVVYGEKYRDTTGIDVLESLGIETQFKDYHADLSRTTRPSTTQAGNRQG